MRYRADHVLPNKPMKQTGRGGDGGYGFPSFLSVSRAHRTYCSLLPFRCAA